MIKLYICPECGWLRAASRRAEVECYRCLKATMVPVKLEFRKYTDMSLKERQDYVDSWMYIHGQRSKA